MDELIEQEATDLGEGFDGEQENDGALEGDDEQQGEETDEPVEGEESEGDEGEDDQPEEDKPAEVASQDGRKMPDAVKKAFANLKSSNPEAAKTLRATWFQNQDYKAAFETPAAAVAMKQAFEDIGGTDGVAQIQSEREEWAQIDQAVAEGKAAELLAGNPEMLTKNAVGVVNEWAKTAPEQYRYYADTVAVNTIQATGLPDELASVYEQLGQFVAQNPELKAYIQPFQTKIAGAYNKIVDLHERAKSYETKRTDPREEALKQKETAFEEQRRADFETRVAGEAETYLGGAVDKAIDALLNGRKADADQREIFREKVQSEVQKRLGQIPGFSTALESHYRTGDQKKSFDYIKQQYDRILGTGKAASVIEPLLRNINQKVTTKPNGTGKPNGQRPAEAGSVSMREMPGWDQIDWSKTTTADVAQGKAVLTNGKRATGW